MIENGSVEIAVKGEIESEILLFAGRIVIAALVSALRKIGSR